MTKTNRSILSDSHVHVKGLYQITAGSSATVARAAVAAFIGVAPVASKGAAPLASTEAVPVALTEAALETGSLPTLGCTLGVPWVYPG